MISLPCFSLWAFSKLKPFVPFRGLLLGFCLGVVLRFHYGPQCLGNRIIRRRLVYRETVLADNRSDSWPPVFVAHGCS